MNLDRCETGVECGSHDFAGLVRPLPSLRLSYAKPEYFYFLALVPPAGRTLLQTVTLWLTS